MNTFKHIFVILTCFLILVLKLCMSLIAVVLGVVVTILLKFDNFLYECFLDMDNSLENK